MTTVGDRGARPGAAERLYAELTSRLVAVERDLVNFPIAYYFAESDERFSLPAVAPYMLASAAGASGRTPRIAFACERGCCSRR